MELSGRAVAALHKAGIHYVQQFENDGRSGQEIMDAISGAPGVWSSAVREVFLFLRNRKRFDNTGNL